METANNTKQSISVYAVTATTYDLNGVMLGNCILRVYRTYEEAVEDVRKGAFYGMDRRILCENTPAEFSVIDEGETHIHVNVELTHLW